MRALLHTEDTELVERLDAATPKGIVRVGALDGSHQSADILVVDGRRSLEGLQLAHVGRSVFSSQLLVAVVDDPERADRALEAGADDILYASDPPARVRARLEVIAGRVRRRLAFDPALGLAIRHLAEAIEVTDSEARFRYVNPAFERLTGYGLEEVLGRTPGELLRSRAHDEAYYHEIITTARAGRVWQGPIISRRKDGTLFETELTLMPVLNATGELDGLVAIRREMGADRDLEAKLRASERMAALGTLAAGVAHEINNPLSYVLANLEHVIEVLEAGPIERLGDLREALEAAHTGGERVRRIVSDMNLLARDHTDSVQPVAMAEVLDATLGVARAMIRAVAQLEVEHEPAPETLANEGRLGQVALNLLVNAVHAVGSDPSKSHRIVVRSGVEGERVFFQVEDDGPGIPEEVRARIFEPFFTTKGPGEGTGLGLSVCHQIVRGYGGFIDVESEPGEGTRVKVSLPALRNGREIEPAPTTTPAQVPELEATLDLLVVDDEPAVCRALARALRKHRVHVAHDGEAALKIMETQHLDAVICDLSMPGMSGAELRDALPEGSPLRERWVFVTGGILRPDDRRHIATFAGPVVHKPFRTDQVRAALTAVVQPDE